MTDSLIAGLATGLTLIIAIGAQNAFVLRQGLARQYVGVVVAICAVADLLLIFAGVSGIATIIERAPQVIDVVRWLGVAFLTWYGVTSLLRARPSVSGAQTLEAARAGAPSLRSAAGRALALTFLNPHVYLDTVLLLGSIANTRGDDRWWFAVGAGTASIVWFTGLGYGARLAHGALSTPRAWRLLDLLIGLVMLGIAVKLAMG